MPQERPCVASPFDAFRYLYIVSQRPNIPNALSGFVLGCWGFYRGDAFSATEVFHPVKFG